MTDPLYIIICMIYAFYDVTYVFCRDKGFVATKMILVAALANDRPAIYNNLYDLRVL